MSLHHLGATRSRRALDHLLQTPDTFVWAPLPGIDRGSVCVHASSAVGAEFSQYTVLFEDGGSWHGDTVTSRFVYVLSGTLRDEADGGKTLHRDGYLYIPPLCYAELCAVGPTRVVVIEKTYAALPGAPEAEPLCGDGNAVSPVPLLGDEGIQVRSLLPADTAYDFAVNTMTYQPGARLAMVEVHVMEHGLLMLEGEGIYRLGDSWYPVTAGDFIWMAPYCPQWFGALGSTPARYLIYKDWNRHPLHAGR